MACYMVREGGVLLPELDPYLTECEGLSYEKFYNCDRDEVNLTSNIPDTLCISKEGKAFLMDELNEKIKILTLSKEVSEDQFVEDRKTFRDEENLKLKNKFKNVEEIVEQFLFSINKEYQSSENKNDNVRMHVSKFKDIKDIPWYRYKNKMSILAEIIKSNTKRLGSLGSKRSVYDLRPAILKNIDKFFKSAFAK